MLLNEGGCFMLLHRLVKNVKKITLVCWWCKKKAIYCECCAKYCLQLIEMAVSSGVN